MACTPVIESFGATPANIKWTIIRGDNAKLRVDFLENDETTFYNTSGWTYTATAYDPANDIYDELVVIPGSGYAEISAPYDITANWGTAYKGVISELAFDLQVYIKETDTVWTPVVGTICVLADVSVGGL